MKKSKENQENEFDIAHQDVLSVLDSLPEIMLDDHQVKQIAKHITGEKDNIYLNYIESAIKELDAIELEEDYNERIDK